MTDKVRPPVKLVGANGNVFNLIGLCQRAARRAGWTPAQIAEFRDRCFNAGSYDAVLAIMMEEFDVE